jgi:hypothetical protein
MRPEPRARSTALSNRSPTRFRVSATAVEKPPYQVRVPSPTPRRSAAAAVVERVACAGEAAGNEASLPPGSASRRTRPSPAGYLRSHLGPLSPCRHPHRLHRLPRDPTRDRTLADSDPSLAGHGFCDWCVRRRRSAPPKRLQCGSGANGRRPRALGAQLLLTRGGWVGALSSTCTASASYTRQPSRRPAPSCLRPSNASRSQRSTRPKVAEARRRARKDLRRIDGSFMETHGCNCRALQTLHQRDCKCPHWTLSSRSLTPARA